MERRDSPMYKIGESNLYFWEGNLKPITISEIGEMSSITAVVYTHPKATAGYAGSGTREFLKNALKKSEGAFYPADIGRDVVKRKSPSSFGGVYFPGFLILLRK